MAAAWLLLLLLAAAGVFAMAPTPLRGSRGITKPDWSYYHTTDEVFSLITKMAEKCDFIQVIRLSGASDDYRLDNTMVVTITDPNSQEPKVPVLIEFGEHGRELISSEIALRLVASVCAATTKQEETDEALGPIYIQALAGLKKHGMSANWVTALLKNVLLKIVPCENPNGRRIVEGGKQCHRMNGRKVDINRNYDNHFGVHPKEYLPSEEYEGTTAFSEPETRITRDVAIEIKPVAFVAIHAGIKELYVPFDHKPVVVESPPLHEVLDILNKKHCQCPTGSAAKTGGYRAMGTATDYMYEVVKAKYVYTWEVVGDLSASSRDCFRGFNPITRADYEWNVANWASAVLTLSDEMVKRELPTVGALNVPETRHSPADRAPLFDPHHPDKNPKPRSNANWSG